jgi:hypothetical protein
MVPRKQAGHMTWTRPQAERQNFLAMRASSAHDRACGADAILAAVKGGTCVDLFSRYISPATIIAAAHDIANIALGNSSATAVFGAFFNW